MKRPAKPDTAPDPQSSQRRVEHMVFESFLALSYAIAKGLIDVSAMTLDGSTPACDLITRGEVEGEEPKVERHTAPTHLQALTIAGKAAHEKLMAHHSATVSCQDYLGALNRLKEIQGPPPSKLILPGGN